MALLLQLTFLYEHYGMTHHSVPIPYLWRMREKGILAQIINWQADISSSQIYYHWFIYWPIISSALTT